MPKPPPAFINGLRSNVSEVRRLVDIHAHLTGSGPGRRHDVEVLNKSGVLLLVATWEACIETIAREGVTFLIEKAKSHRVIPEKAKAAVARRLERASEDYASWKLAGNGWKKELVDQTEFSIGKLNTPNAENIDRLFEEVLGFRKISNNWCWKGSTRKSAADRLDRLIELRHEIAHQVEASRSVKKSYVIQSTDFVIRLAAVSGNRVRAHLKEKTGSVPWGIYVKGAAK